MESQVTRMSECNHGVPSGSLCGICEWAKVRIPDTIPRGVTITRLPVQLTLTVQAEQAITELRKVIDMLEKIVPVATEVLQLLDKMERSIATEE
jgi:hypothetical protein